MRRLFLIILLSLSFLSLFFPFAIININEGAIGSGNWEVNYGFDYIPDNYIELYLLCFAISIFSELFWDQKKWTLIFAFISAAWVLYTASMLYIYWFASSTSYHQYGHYMYGYYVYVISMLIFIFIKFKKNIIFKNTTNSVEHKKILFGILTSIVFTFFAYSSWQQLFLVYKYENVNCTKERSEDYFIVKENKAIIYTSSNVEIRKVENSENHTSITIGYRNQGTNYDATNCISLTLYNMQPHISVFNGDEVSIEDVVLKHYMD